MSNITVYGLLRSPFARKCCMYLREKALPYSNIPYTPRQFTPEDRKHSPLGKVPFAQIDGKWLADSSVICAYIEKLHPTPALYPANPWDYARALWFEEFFDGGAAPKLISTIFYERFIKPKFLQQTTDEAKVKAAIDNDMPGIYSYLDAEIGNNNHFVANTQTIADVTAAAFFVNMQMVDCAPNADRYPNLSRYLEYQHSRPAIAAILEEETAGAAA